MSTRAFRKLHGDDEIKKLAAELKDSQSDDNAEVTSTKNPFALLEGDDQGPESEGSEEAGETLEAKNESTKTGPKRKKKNRKKKRGQNRKESDYDFEASLSGVTQAMNAAGLVFTKDKNKPEGKSMLAVEVKHLHAESELTRLFGADVGVRKVFYANYCTCRRPRRHAHAYKSHCLVYHKDTWPPAIKTGLQMNLVHSEKNHMIFHFEHHTTYQKVQAEFHLATQTHNPDNLTRLMRENPYHIDTLLQLSDIAHMNEDYQIAADLIERALYAHMRNFHNCYSLSSPYCRIPYKQKENRGFLLALFHRITYIGRRGCYRTALEHCKLLLSLDPEKDPLAVLLMIDFFAIKSKQYDWLITFFEQYESSRNLTQLPNWAFSVALALFLKDGKKGNCYQQATDMLVDSILMFPGMILPLLNKINVVADDWVEKHPFLNAANCSLDPGALKTLERLYVERCGQCWKNQQVLPWLEKSVKSALQLVKKPDARVADYQEKRRHRYKSPPKNMYRHIFISRLEKVISMMPTSILDGAVLSYDPFPPSDTQVGYELPGFNEQLGGNAVSMFFRSLVPNFDLNRELQAQGALGGFVPAAPLGAGGGMGERLQNQAAALLNTLQNMLQEIQPPALPVGGDEPPNPDWAEWDDEEDDEWEEEVEDVEIVEEWPNQQAAQEERPNQEATQEEQPNQGAAQAEGGQEVQKEDDRAEGGV